MNKIKSRLLVSIMCIVLLAAFTSWCAWRIWYINKLYPASEHKEYNVGDKIDYYGLDITVNSYEYLSSDEVLKEYPDLINSAAISSVDTDDVLYCLVVDLTAENNSEEAKTADITEMVATSSPYSYEVCPSEVNKYVNNGDTSKGSIRVSVDPGQTYNSKYLYVIDDKTFIDSDEKTKIKDMKFNYVLGAYPYYISVNLN
jgi:hypothetical protein